MKKFINELHKQHTENALLPSAKLINSFIDTLFSILFPAYCHSGMENKDEIEEALEYNQEQLKLLLKKVPNKKGNSKSEIAKEFYAALPEIYHLLMKDVAAIEGGDPAANDKNEVMRTYPGFYAISIYRLAHCLHQLGVTYVPRMMTEVAHSKTGIDIHPGAIIGKSFFIDHGTGIVIGETTIIGDHVKLYQGVTLGALSVRKEMAATKRHPTIGDSVVIYSGATILGGKTMIGKKCIIGGNVWITSSVDPGTIVYHKPELKILKGKVDHGKVD